jgi:hypothetical protein
MIGRESSPATFNYVWDSIQPAAKQAATLQSTAKHLDNTTALLFPTDFIGSLQRYGQTEFVF